MRILFLTHYFPPEVSAPPRAPAERTARATRWSSTATSSAAASGACWSISRFQGRGRTVTTEYLAKWYIFWDSITRKRTDGALLRRIAMVPDPRQAEAADERLQEFVRAA